MLCAQYSRRSHIFCADRTKENELPQKGTSRNRRAGAVGTGGARWRGCSSCWPACAARLPLTGMRPGVRMAVAQQALIRDWIAQLPDTDRVFGNGFE